MAKLNFAKEVEQKTSKIPQLAAEGNLLETDTHLRSCWALKITPPAARFSEKQKSYPSQKFSEGQTTGQNHYPETVSRAMRTGKTFAGNHLFEYNEFSHRTADFRLLFYTC